MTLLKPPDTAYDPAEAGRYVRMLPKPDITYDVAEAGLCVGWLISRGI